MRQDVDLDYSERPGTGIGFAIIKNWDQKLNHLKKDPQIEILVNKMGFSLTTLLEVLIKEFPFTISFEDVNNSSGQKIEDVATETLTVNNRDLDRLLVKAYPPAANSDIKEMTQFQAGGEVILITNGTAELTLAAEIKGNIIPKTSLQTVKVEKGDLIISTDTPNNWTHIDGNEFSFIYFVGNPNGPQKYGDIPKVKVPVV